MIKVKRNNEYLFSEIYIDEKKKKIVGSDVKSFLNDSYFIKFATIYEFDLLLICLISISFKLFSNIDLRTILPILPNPFIPIFIFIIFL